MQEIWILLIVVGVISVYLGSENWLNLRRIRLVRHRIHVNGSRGKSSVTRLVAAALREAGLKTIAKTTGSSPRFIFPDGSEVLIRRLGQANIKEQLKIAHWARLHRPDAIVVECMALAPQNQWASEHRMLRSTLGVCTNVRADHLDIMGPEVADVEKALAGTVPRGGVFVTTERTYTGVLRRACEDNDTRFVQVTGPEVDAVTAKEMSAFTYIEHEDNVALALKVAELLGIGRETALKGMHSCNPDVGALRRWDLVFYGRTISWINAFAANDPASTRMIWDRIRELIPDSDSRILVVNCRDDRPDRSRQLGRLAPLLDDVDRFVLTGSGTEVFARAAVRGGIRKDRIYTMVGETVLKVFERIVSWSGTRAVILGVGNIKGMGAALDEYFRNRAVRPERN
ncbi:MAG: poly-gamma-glutamate synthase PgsB [Deltaproteobacteria bacterium]|nr:poly-gamma-glutamate synthase PgsB [Deltaproteobacteria bacterium]